MRRLILATLVVAAPSVAEPCDPAATPPPVFAASGTVEDDLFADERAARGTCTVAAERPDFRDSPVEVSEKQARVFVQCDGVCEPMRSKLAPLDSAHDLEDLTFQKECRDATAKLPEKARAPCLRVCVAERRFFAAPAIFGRTVRALESTLPSQPGGGLKLADVRKAARNSGFGPLPSNVTLDEVTDRGPRRVRATGWVRPGGAALRLQTNLLGSGCGQSAWGIERW